MEKLKLKLTILLGQVEKIEAELRSLIDKIPEIQISDEPTPPDDPPEGDPGGR